ncbi:MAG TPA: hypothetical protein PLP19_07950 [bacterium]|nr:hypothetical protein [bacterium]HPN43405.1 hypothetical protein [bacterium]
MNQKYIIVAFLVITSVFGVSCKNDVTEPDNKKPAPVTETPKYEPPDGDCLFILGQSNTIFMDAYMNKVRKTPTPAGFAFYTSLSNNAVQQDMPRYKTYLDKYPNTVLQLAIWTGERQWGDPGYYLDDIVDGKYDQNIIALASACKTFDRPIFIRLGYEFDGSHNAYPPDKYIAAWRYFVDKMRGQGVTNVAYVWHSWGVGAYYGHDDFPDYYPELPAGTAVTQELWYPGDDYVDWVGMSIFGIGWGNLATNSVVQWLITFAETHNKPVMLAETAAIRTADGADPAWVIPNTKWLEQVFGLCRDNPAVKAFTYINVDWMADNPSSSWGDTQIQSSTPTVITYWLDHIKSFQHADSTLYGKIGYVQ